MSVKYQSVVCMKRSTFSSNKIKTDLCPATSPPLGPGQRGGDGRRRGGGGGGGGGGDRGGAGGGGHHAGRVEAAPGELGAVHGVTLGVIHVEHLVTGSRLLLAAHLSVLTALSTRHRALA